MARAPAFAALLLAVSAVPRAAAADSGALAVELSALVLPEEIWNKSMAGVAEQVRQTIEGSMRAAGENPPPEFAARFAEEFARMYGYQEMRDLQAALLVKYYTEAEIRELLAFYRTPLGRKAIRIQPEVTQDLYGEVMLIVQQRMPAMMERLRPMLEDAEKGASDTPAPAPAKKAPQKRAR